MSGDPFSNNHSDWRYRYNAMGEREQKRLYHAPLADSIAGNPYPWVYYLLGGSKDQLAVWHGQQMTSTFCDTVKLRNVFLYPTEYLTNGIGWNGVHEDITPIITRPDGTKEYRISDHLASLRVSLTNGSPMKAYDYDPWGNLLGVTTTPRRGFNDNEKDRENGLFSLGVRKYEEGRFISVDPLWELDPETSPYVYAGNDPLSYVDPGGMQRIKIEHSPSSLPYMNQAGGGLNGIGGVRNPGSGGSSGRPGGGTGPGSARPPQAPEHTGARSRAAALRSAGAQPGVGVGANTVASNMGAQGAAGGASSGGGKGGNNGGGNSGGGNGGSSGSSSGTPNSAWTKDAPKQVTPGTKTIEHQKYNTRTGQVEQSTVHYDEYGRQVGRTDHTNHGYPANHTNPHYHVTTYGTGTSHGQERGPYPGTYKPIPE